MNIPDTHNVEWQQVYNCESTYFYSYNIVSQEEYYVSYVSNLQPGTLNGLTGISSQIKVLLELQLR